MAISKKKLGAFLGLRLFMMMLVLSEIPTMSYCSSE